MEKTEVIQTLETFASQPPADLPSAVRDAVVSAVSLLKTARTRAPNKQLPSAGLAWSGEEDARLLQEYDASMTTAQIALAHGRTSGAIVSRLVKLGRIDPASVRSRERGARLSQ